MAFNLVAELTFFENRQMAKLTFFLNPSILIGSKAFKRSKNATIDTRGKSTKNAFEKKVQKAPFGVLRSRWVVGVQVWVSWAQIRWGHPIVCQSEIINLTISMIDSLAATVPKVFEVSFCIGMVVIIKPLSFALSVIRYPGNHEICAWKKAFQLSTCSLMFC